MTNRHFNDGWNLRQIPDRVMIRASTRWVADGECRISTYSLGSHGYPQLGWKDDGVAYMALAHRAAWENSMGRVPVGYTLDHVCKNRRCVNADHLRILPNYENARRTAGRDWPLGQCVNGHPNSELREYGNGAGRTKLKCRICVGDYQRRYRSRIKDGAARAVNA